MPQVSFVMINDKLLIPWLTNSSFTNNLILSGKMKRTDAKSLTKKHQALTHSEQQTVVSHVQREDDEWYLNTIMIKGIDVPFKYRRKKLYKSLQKQQVNITYYPAIETVAGFEMEVMKIVRIKVC